MSTAASPTSETPSAAPAITLWPADVLARHLVAPDPTLRVLALGMALQPNAPVNACRDSLAQAAQLSLGDPLAAQMAAAALGCLAPEAATALVQQRLTDLVAIGQTMPVRIAAAHALFRLKCLPSPAGPAVCEMLLATDESARKVALLCFIPFAKSQRAVIAGLLGQADPTTWSTEALQALAHSAEGDAVAQKNVEDFLMRSLANAPLVPTGIAAYAALARINPRSSALNALLQTAASANEPVHWRAALDALGGLGESAKPIARQLGEVLIATEDPARQEALCRALLTLRPAHRDLPAACIVQRVQQAGGRSAAAHCLLLCLCPKEFASAAPIVRQRFAIADPALKAVLAQTFKTLTATELTMPVTESGVE